MTNIVTTISEDWLVGHRSGYRSSKLKIEPKKERKRLTQKLFRRNKGEEERTLSALGAFRLRF